MRVLFPALLGAALPLHGVILEATNNDGINPGTGAGRGPYRAALFEDSEIRTVGDSAHAGGGSYVVQARTVAAGEPGFVFLNSRLTQGPAAGCEPARAGPCADGGAAESPLRQQTAIIQQLR